jgi:ATP-dependent exoDNAse (exonuclease V) beta subunit
MIQIMKASAGSGKTYSLARKYISLILSSKDRYA